MDSPLRAQGTYEFPRSPSEISPAALAKLLGASRLADTRVLNTAVSVLGGGRGYLGQVARVAVDYDGANALPKTFIFKFGSAGGTSRQTATQVGMYRREIGFYQELAPNLSVSVPEVWAVRSDSCFVDHVIVLEDVKSVKSDQILGCSPDDAAAVLEAIAELHGSTWLDPRLREREWIPTLATPARIDNLTGLARRGWDILQDVAGDLIDDRGVALGAELSRRIPLELERLDAMQWCLLHGDLRLDNVLLRPSGSKPVFIDWQGLTIGPAILDVGYFLIQSLTTQYRRAHLHELLDVYVQKLRSLGVTPPAPEEASAGLGSAAIFSLVVACSVPLLDKSRSERAVALSRSMVERSLSAYFDLR